jgi:hypothetical protein
MEIGDWFLDAGYLILDARHRGLGPGSRLWVLISITEGFDKYGHNRKNFLEKVASAQQFSGRGS